jgi:hypothetical protein
MNFSFIEMKTVGFYLTVGKKPDNPQANEIRQMLDVYYTVIDKYLYIFKCSYLYNKYL